MQGQNDYVVGAGVTGDVLLSANFDTMLISGSIINRDVFDIAGVLVGGETVADVTLQSAAISGAGLFNGTATGGTFNEASGDFATGAGTFEGVIGGKKASDVAGHVLLIHDGTPGAVTTVVENGIFIAD